MPKLTPKPVEGKPNVYDYGDMRISPAALRIDDIEWLPAGWYPFASVRPRREGQEGAWTHPPLTESWTPANVRDTAEEARELALQITCDWLDRM